VSESKWGDLTRSKRGELFAALDEILWYQWDPIGVNTEAPARMEYTSYVYPILYMVFREASVTEIKKRLARMRTSSMGLRPDPEVDELVATACIKACDQILSR
jgi:hypothetical protein